MAKNRIKQTKRVKVSRGFYRDQFKCKCGCGFDTVDYNLIVVLQKLTDKIGIPVEIFEGCTCPNRQKTGPFKEHGMLIGRGVVISVPAAPSNNIKDPMNNKDIGKTLDSLFGDVIYYYPIEKSDVLVYVSVENV